MNLEDFETLELAKVAPLVVGKLIHRDTMNSLLGKAQIYIDFKALALDVDSPFQNIVAAFLDSKEYSFIIGDPIGDDLIKLLDNMIASNLNISPALGILRPKLILASNPISYPFKNKTLHEFKIAKNNCEQVNVTAIDGHVTINVSADCEQHNPRLMATNPRTDKTTRINNFMGVSKAGKYDCVVPTANRGWTLSVDNAYGVVS